MVIGVPMTGGLGPDSGRVVLSYGVTTQEVHATCPKCSTPSVLLVCLFSRDGEFLEPRLRCECGRPFFKDGHDFQKFRALLRVVGDDVSALQGFFDEHVF